MTSTIPKMKNKTICLNMIVKDESHIIERTLNNLTTYIQFDYWVICDTGSSDNTISLIKQFFENKNIPGELVEEEWRDFAYNRTKAIEYAKNKADYLFIFDADDTINGDFKLPSILNKDKYSLKYSCHVNNSPITWYRGQIISTNINWKYKGVLHEFLVNDTVINGSEDIEGNYFVTGSHDGNRSKDPQKWQKDALILENAFNDEKDIMLKGRYAFYCGQSHKCYGNKEKSIEWYKKVLDLNNWNQEKYYSAYTIGFLNNQLGNIDSAIKYYLLSDKYDKDRIEGIVSLVELFYNKGYHILVNSLYHKYKNYSKPTHKLFLFDEKYNDELEYYNSISAFYSNDLESGYLCCKKIISNNIAKSSRIEQTLKNMRFYIENLKKDNEKTYKFFQSITNIINKKLKNTLSITELIDIYKILFDKNKHILSQSDYDLYNKLFPNNTNNLPIKKSVDSNNSNNNTNYDEKDILLIMNQTNCTREIAINSLQESNGDIVSAILNITM